MDKNIKILGGLLAAQLLLAVWAFSGGSDLAAQRPEEPLLAFDPASVTRITIEGREDAKVTLSIGDGGWTLKSAWDAPASQAKVAQLLQRLEGLKKGLAVATSSGARPRFEVSEENFQRRITLTGGDDTLGVVYLGTSPAMRKIHARTADVDPVYAVSFSAYEAPAKADDWLDSGLMQIPEPELEGIGIAGLTLTKSKAEGDDESGWKADGLADGGQLDQSKVRELAGNIGRLEVRKVLGTDTKPEYRQDSPELALTLQRAGDEAVTWTLSKPEKGEDHVLKSSEHPWYFEVSSWTAKPLLDAAKRDSLVVSPKPVDEAGAVDAPDTGKPQAGE